MGRVVGSESDVKLVLPGRPGKLYTLHGDSKSVVLWGGALWGGGGWKIVSADRSLLSPPNGTRIYYASPACVTTFGSYRSLCIDFLYVSDLLFFTFPDTGKCG